MSVVDDVLLNIGRAIEFCVEKKEELVGNPQKEAAKFSAERLRAERLRHYRLRHDRFSNVRADLTPSLEEDNPIYLSNVWNKNIVPWKLCWQKLGFGDDFEGCSNVVVKITIPGPLTISDTIANDYYASNKDMAHDLAEAINQEINTQSKQ